MGKVIKKVKNCTKEKKVRSNDILDAQEIAASLFILSSGFFLPLFIFELIKKNNIAAANINPDGIALCIFFISLIISISVFGFKKVLIFSEKCERFFSSCMLKKIFAFMRYSPIIIFFSGAFALLSPIYRFMGVTLQLHYLISFSSCFFITFLFLIIIINLISPEVYTTRSFYLLTFILYSILLSVAFVIIMPL